MSDCVILDNLSELATLMMDSIDKKNWKGEFREKRLLKGLHGYLLVGGKTLPVITQECFNSKSYIKMGVVDVQEI